MTRLQYMRKLAEDGYQAALAGKPCEAPAKGELKRAAWEIGWRDGHREMERKQCK